MGESKQLYLLETQDGGRILDYLRKHQAGQDADIMALRLLEIGSARECIGLAELKLPCIDGEWIANRIIEVGDISEMLDYARSFPGPWRKRVMLAIGQRAKTVSSEYWWESRRAITAG